MRFQSFMSWYQDTYTFQCSVQGLILLKIQVMKCILGTNKEQKFQGMKHKSALR